MMLLVFACDEKKIMHGYWNGSQFEEQSSFKTPTTWEQLKQDFLTVYESLKKPINGIALSVPGIVNTEKQRIEGATEISYLHGFNIFAELEELFRLPVTIENDINCAAMAEFYLGAAKNTQDSAFVAVEDDEIKGALFTKGQLHKGNHLYSGQFGYMYLNNGNTFSELATPAQMAFRYCQRMELDPTEKNSDAVFTLAKTGDKLAKEEVNNFYEYLVAGLWNIQFLYDPELIVLAGDGIVGKNTELLEEINQRLLKKLSEKGIDAFVLKIKICHYPKQAPLIGAAMNFSARQQGEV